MEEKNKNTGQNKMPKENPFRVPDGYFENLGAEIEKKIQSQEEKPPKKIKLWAITRHQLALAAGIILFVIISSSVMHFILDRGPDDSFPTGHYADLIENGIEDYDTELLINEYIETVDQEETPLVVESENEISNDEIIDFLLHENVELDMILNEL